MNKPEIIYYDNGQKWYEKYYNDKGEYHREDGPAITEWNKNGQKDVDFYSINGFYHREDGPAIICWNNNGQIKSEEYWINGIHLDKFQIRKLKLENLNLL